jgi:hypothetical protein
MEILMQVNHHNRIPRQRRATPGTYAAQLAARVAELLPDVNEAERLELLGVMDEGDLRASLAWLASFAPHMFDCALVRDRQLLERLEERASGDQADDDLEPYCTTCGATVGIFHGHGDGYHHYRTGPDSRSVTGTGIELYDAGHAPAVSWAPAGER